MAKREPKGTLALAMSSKNTSQLDTIAKPQAIDVDKVWTANADGTAEFKDLHVGGSDFTEYKYLAFGDSQALKVNTITYVPNVFNGLNMVSYLNKALPGSTITDAPVNMALEVKRIASVLEKLSTYVTDYNTYDVVTLGAGINDVTSIKSGDITLGDFDNMLLRANADTLDKTIFYDAIYICCKELIEAFNGKYILLITPPRTEYSNEYTNVVNAMVEVGEYWSLPIYKSDKLETITSIMSDFTTWFPDNLHGTDEYNELKARKIINLLKTL